MQRFKGHRIYTLTPCDIDRLKCLLHSVAEAVVELIEYRAVEPIDLEADFPIESAVYRQTSEILKRRFSLDDDRF
jgi:hypothetical protein